MKRILLHIVLITFSLHASGQILPNLGGQRAGIAALTFLKNDISPRSLALGGSNLCLNPDGMATFHNPALMPQTEGVHIAVNDLNLGADIHQSWFSATAPLKSSTSAIGLNMNYLSTGAMEVRTEFQPNGTGSYFYANQFAAGLAYGKLLSDRFSFGANLKFVHERLAQYSSSTVTADLGFLYTTDVRNLKFGIVVKNFGGNSSLRGSFIQESYNRDSINLDKYSVPTVFRLGAAINAWEVEDQKVVFSVQLEHPNDNSENLRLGVEYDFKEIFFARSGYKINVLGQRYPSFGIGYRARLGRNTLMVNYGVNPTEYLGVMHVFGLDLKINSDKRE